MIATPLPSSTAPSAAPPRTRRSRTRTIRFHKVTSADGTRIEAWSNDADGPTVLICNGLGSSPHAWPELMKAGCGLHVISWNHRGTGRSARPEDPAAVDVEAFVEDALAVLDDAGIDRCVVAGWSSGVATAFELAVRHPDRVSGILAVAGVPVSASVSRGAPLRVPGLLREPVAAITVRLLTMAAPALNPVARRIPMGPVSTTMLRYSGMMLPTARPSDVKRAVRELLTTPVDWYLHLALATSTQRRLPLSSVRVPTAFLAGRFDLLCSPNDMRALSEQLPDSTYESVLGTHFIVLERSREVAAALRDLVARVDEGS